MPGALLGLVAVLLLAGGSLLSTAAPAAAHATLVATDPADDARLDVVPGTVTLTFDEPVDARADALRVFDADARRVDDGPVAGGDGSVVAVALPDDLADGGYVASYRVVSEDAHPIAGVFTFVVGDGAAVDAATVGELAEGAADGPARPLGMVLRGLSYAATLLAAGGAVYAALVARRDRDRAPARRSAVRAAIVGIVVTLLGIPVQAVVLVGGGLGDAVSPEALGEALASSAGLGALVRAAALAWLVVLWRPRMRPAVPAVVGLLATASYALDGHQRTTEPGWLLIGGDVVHLAAAATWFGGVVLLAGALRRRSLGDDPVEAAGLVARFSGVALGAFAVVAAAGVAMAVPLVGSVTALTTTTYGWLLVAKVAAVAVVVLLAVYNRQRLVPAVAARRIPAGASVATGAPAEEQGVARSEAAWHQLRRTVHAEVALLVVVLAVTGVLVSVQPASEAAGGVHAATASLDDGLDVDVVVDPNEVGTNAIHLYVLEPTGQPSSAVEDLHIELTYAPQDIGPIMIEPFVAGPGHWVANVDELTFAGDWELRVVAGLDRFTEASATVTVPVAP